MFKMLENCFLWTCIHIFLNFLPRGSWRMPANFVLCSFFSWLSINYNACYHWIRQFLLFKSTLHEVIEKGGSTQIEIPRKPELIFRNWMFEVMLSAFRWAGLLRTQQRSWGWGLAGAVRGEQPGLGPPGWSDECWVSLSDSENCLRVELNFLAGNFILPPPPVHFYCILLAVQLEWPFSDNSTSL